VGRVSCNRLVNFVICTGSPHAEARKSLATDRRGPRYPFDLTDAEWALIASPIPPGQRGERKRSVGVREVLYPIFYVFATGCQWMAC